MILVFKIIVTIVLTCEFVSNLILHDNKNLGLN